MRILTYTFLLLSSILLLFGCTEDVEYDVGEQDPVLVVDGAFTTEKKAHEVKLTWSSGVYDREAPVPVENATVVITSGSEIIALSELEPGKYYTADSVAGEIGKFYALNISYEGESFNSSEIELRDVPSMDCAFMLDGDSSNIFTQDKFLFLMAAQEPEGVGDYYLWNLYDGDSLLTDTIGEKIYNSDELIDGQEFTRVPIFFLDTVDVDVYSDLKLEMLSISADYYDFLIALQMERFRGSPFDGPAANVPTNMSNGALGFFVVSDVEVSNICKVIEPFDQIFDCDFSCFEVMCKQGLIPCDQCESIGLDC